MILMSLSNKYNYIIIQMNYINKILLYDFNEDIDIKNILESYHE